MIHRGETFLLIRYVDDGQDCINNHIRVLDKYGYCWFAKMGVAPSIKSIKKKLNHGHPYIILYSQGNAYICKLLDYTYEKPKEGYPKYYQQYLYERHIFPKMNIPVEWYRHSRTPGTGVPEQWYW